MSDPTPPPAAGLPGAPLGGLPRYGKSALSPEQKRRQRWLLGCAGAVVLLFLVGVGSLGFWGVTQGKNLMYSGPVDSATMQSQLGPEAPLYPNGEVDEIQTRAAMAGMNMAGRLVERAGVLDSKAAVALNTSDSREQVLEYYRKELAAHGWKERSSDDGAMGILQVAFERTPGDTLTLQLRPRQDRMKGTSVIMVRMKLRRPGAAAGGGSGAPQPK